MPILVFFLSLMGIVSAGFMWKNFRYSILVIFIVAAIVTPTTDIVNMCIFAAPMIALYCDQHRSGVAGTSQAASGTESKRIAGMSWITVAGLMSGVALVRLAASRLATAIKQDASQVQDSEQLLPRSEPTRVRRTFPSGERSAAHSRRRTARCNT